MRRHGLLIACLALFTTAAHAADPPAAAAAASAPPTTVAVPAASADTATASAATMTTSAASTPAATAPDRVYGGGLTTVEIERAFKKFRRTERDGGIQYCRREAPLGTRLGKLVCYTAEQVLAMARAEREAGLMTSQQNVCGIGSCNPGGGG